MSVKPFIDTNILVYAHDVTAGDKYQSAQNIIAKLWREGGGCLSVQVLQELYVTLNRKVEGVTPTIAGELIEDYSRWQLHKPHERDVIAAITLHQRQQVSFWDAMVLNSATVLGCTHIFSEDLNAGQTLGGVKVVNPFSEFL